MAYRLICIYETSANQAIPDLRIEVCIDGKSQSLSPFQRKVSLSDLYSEGVVSGISLLPLLNHAGLEHQPFRINPRFLQSTAVLKTLHSHPYTYVQPNGKGSVHKSTCPLPPIGISSYPTSQLIGGELYIDHLATWHRSIKVRLRYQNAISAFYPSYSAFPFLALNGQMMQRDESAEIKQLQFLGTNYDPATATLSFDDSNTSILETLSHQGWHIYIINQQKSRSLLFAHRLSSGITWFSTDEAPDIEEFAQQLLEGFMHSRNYSETDGKITIFKKQDAIKTDDTTLAVRLGAPQDALILYKKEEPLSESEKQLIVGRLSSRLQTTLYPYQRDGVLWLQKQRKNRHGCLLADEMGLGKTIQVIAHLCCLEFDTHHLIIAPTSLIYNWQNEIRRFAPQLLSQVTLVSYDMLRLHLDDYVHQSFDTIIIDEAQAIKNRQTKKYQAVSQLQCLHRIILTGTPIENSIDELWSHFMILMPPIKGLYHKLQLLGMPSVSEAYIALSSRLLKPFILRREKIQVLTDLPERTEKTIYIELSQNERAIYNKVHSAIVHALDTGISGRVNSIGLEALLRLRQACVSSNLLPQTITSHEPVVSTKLHTALELIDTFRSEHRQVLVFSQFVSALHEIEQLLDKNDIRYVSLYGDTRDRKTPVQQFQKDSKITVFLISLKAGGFGLNLTSADRVILLDDWWNPAVEDQAMSRAHRIGQKHNVLVLRLVCKDTVEEKILQLQDQKRLTVDQFNTTNEKITLEEIKQLISYP